MKRRELILLAVLLVVVVAVGGVFVFSTGLFSGFSFAGNSKLRDEIEEKQEKVRELEAKKAEWEHYRSLSLPGGNRHNAMEEYHKFLGDMVGKCKFDSDSKVSAGTLVETPATTTLQRNNKQPFVRVTYNIQARGSISAIFDFLERFYRAPKLHQIHSINIHRPDKDRSGQDKAKQRLLDFEATVEALILDGVDGDPSKDWYQITADSMQHLAEDGVPEDVLQKLKVLQNPSALPFSSQEKYFQRLQTLLGTDTLAKYKDKLVHWGTFHVQPLQTLSLQERSYKDLEDKNPFYAPIPPKPQVTPPSVPPPPDPAKVTKFTKLTRINRDRIGRVSAYLWDLAGPQTKDEIKLTIPVDAKFQLRDDNDPDIVLLTGTACKIDIEQGDVYFRIDPPKEASPPKGSTSKGSSSKGSTAAAESKYYKIHIGQKIYEAMGEKGDNALSRDQVRELGLPGPDNRAE